MKLICERGYLNAALSLVIGRAKANNPIPILYHVRLTAGDSKLRLCATDLEAMSESHLDADVRSPGVAIIDAHRFAKLVAGFPKGAQIAIEGSETDVTVKCSRSIYKLPSLPESDWPTMESHSEPSQFSLDASVVRTLFETPAAAVEPPKGRVYLTGGYLHQPARGKISVVATNGHMLLQSIADCDFTLPIGVIVPKAAMNEIAKIATGTVKFECTANLIAVETEACRFTSKLIDATFPEYQRLIPTTDGACIHVEREHLIAAIRRLDVMDEGKNTLKMDWREGGNIVVTLEDAGRGEEQIEAEIDLPSIGGIGVAPSLLLPTLEAFDGDTVRLFMTDPGNPIRIAGETDAVVGVVMPKRM